jgi:hypothetical protein
MCIDQSNLEKELILEKEIYMVNQRNLDRERTFEGKSQDSPQGYRKPRVNHTTYKRLGRTNKRGN